MEASTLTLAEAGEQTLAFLKKHIHQPRTVPLAGNSIGTDRRFLAAQLPEIEDYLHYRSVDVSTDQGAVPALAPRRLQGGAVEEGRPPGAAGHPRERRRAGLLPGRHLRADRNSDRGGDHVSATGKDTPTMSIAEANDALTATGPALRDGGARHPRRADPDLEERATLAARRLGHVARPRRRTPSSSTRTSGRPSPSTTASPARWPTGSAPPSASSQGDRVAIIMRNLPEWVMAFWGAALAGAIVVPLNAWWSGEELRYGLEDSGSKVAFVDTERAERIRPFLGGLDGLGAMVVADEHRTELKAPLAVFEPPGGAAPVPEWPFPLAVGHRGRGRLAARPHHRPGGRRHDLLHVGHDRATQGRGGNPPQHVHQPHEPVLHQHPRLHALRQRRP